MSMHRSMLHFINKFELIKQLTEFEWKFSTKLSLTTKLLDVLFLITFMYSHLCKGLYGIDTNLANHFTTYIEIDNTYIDKKAIQAHNLTEYMYLQRGRIMNFVRQIITQLTFKNRENSSKKKNSIDIGIQTSIIRRPNQFINLSFIHRKKKRTKSKIDIH